MINKKDITGIILAGGKSSRMGTDKAMLLYKDKPFLQHIIDIVNEIVAEIIIVSNHKKHDSFGVRRIEDDIENAGPLAGVYSGLRTSKTKYNLVLSCDIPLINKEIILKLINNIDNAYEVIQIKSNNKAMPLVAIYKNECESTFLKFLQSGERRLQHVVNQCETKTITLNLEDDLFVKNINAPEQLKEITI